MTPRSPARRRMVVTTVVLLVAGFSLQLLAFGDGGHVALSDLPRVLLHRGIAPTSVPYVDRVLEYPVGSGLLLYLATLVSPGSLGAFVVTASASAALCIAITVALERRYGARAWRWALGVPVALYAFQNWDVFALAAMLAGMFAYVARRERLAGVMLGLGAAVKLFPAVLVVPLAALRVAQGDRDGARRIVSWSAAVFIAVNAPFALLNPSGWWWTYAFQGHRQATWGTAWFYLYRALDLPVHGAAGSSVANLVSMAALAFGIIWVSWRARRSRVPAEALAVAAVAVLLLAGKVYSPAYDLWLLPAFALLPLPRRLWFAYCAVDLAVFATVYGYFHALVAQEFVGATLPILVAVRTAILLLVVRSATRRESAADVAVFRSPAPAPEARAA